MNRFFALSSAFKVLILLVPTLSIAISCSSKNSSTPEFEGVQSYEFANPSELDRAVKNYHVSCSGPCPKNAGVLLVKDGSRLMACSFSLVDSQVILTNRHCLPESLAKAGASCQDAIQAVFKNDSGEKEIEICDKVLSYATEWKEGENTKIDFAFLKLKNPVPRTPLQVNTSGIQDKEVLKALTATPDTTREEPGSILIAKTCTAHMNSLINLAYSNPLKPVIAFKGCDIVHGNSGSAMVDANGKIKAIVQAKFTANNTSIDQKQDLTSKILRATSKGSFSLGTNIGCVQNEELHLSPLETTCDSRVNENSEDGVALVKSLVDEKAIDLQAARLQEQANSASDVFKLKVKMTPPSAERSKVFGDIMYMTLEPLCIKGSAKAIPWLQQFEEPGHKGPPAKYPQKASTEFSQPFLRYFIDVDEDAKLAFKNAMTVYTVNIDLPLREIAKTPGNQFNLKGTASTSPSHVEIPKSYNLKLCEE